MAEMDLYEFALPEKMKPEQRLFKDFVVVNEATRIPLGLANVKLKGLDEKKCMREQAQKHRLSKGHTTERMICA